MTDKLKVYEGRARRRCPKCGFEVEVVKPIRVLGRESTRAWRLAARKELGRQLLWEGMCEGPDGCRKFWNDVLRAIETGKPVESRPDRVAGQPSVRAQRQAIRALLGLPGVVERQGEQCACEPEDAER